MDVAAGKMPPSKLGVESAGPHTLVVHLHAPTAYLLALLTNAYLDPIYEPAVKQWGDSWTQPGHMISNGPFLLSERVINGHITLDKNPYYWDAGHVRLSRVIYHAVADNDATTRPISGRQSRLYRSIQRLRKGTAAARCWATKSCSHQFCDGDVQLQPREASLCREIPSCAWRSTWPWTATFW